MNSFTRAARWNARRYDRVLNVALLKGLLLEEIRELLEATEEVDKLDALADIAFVSYGGVWKAGATDDTIRELQSNAETATDAMLELSSEAGLAFSPVSAMLSLVYAMDEASATKTCLALVDMCGLLAAVELKLSSAQFEAAMLVVCDSNDSKVIKKTDPSVKANIDKGQFFVAPEPRLQEILNARPH